MRKKLFVVLTAMTAVLVIGSLVTGAKKGVIKGVPERFEMPKFMNKQNPTPLPLSATPLPPKPPIIRSTPTIPTYHTAPTHKVPRIPSSPLSAKEKYVPGELLVRFKPEATSTEISVINQQIGCEVIRGIKFIEVYHLRITSGLTVEEAVERYSRNPNVEFAEPNYIGEAAQRVLNNAERWPDVAPDPTFNPAWPEYGWQWSLDNWGQALAFFGGVVGTVDADIDAPQMWRMITAADPDIIVAILDTGIEWYHEDLRPNIWQNLAEDADGDGKTIEFVGGVWVLDPGDLNGLDDDANNYIDDLIGFDFPDNDNNPDDEFGHGTHVAGIVGAVGNNGIGVTGVCWSVNLIPVRILNAFGNGNTADLCLGIDYAMHGNAKIINMSLQNYEYSHSLEFAVGRANQQDILVVAAAGNLGRDIDVPGQECYPGSLPNPNVITVAASDHSDAKPDWSNWGAISVDLAAPGECIYSTMPIHTVTMNNVLNNCTGANFASNYDFMSGTSMASPHVSGVAALCWTLERILDPGFSQLQLKDVLLNEPFSFNAADKEKKPAFQLGGAGEVFTEGRLRAAQNADFGDAPDPPYSTFWPPLGWGALHLDCGLEWLGYDISLERDVLDLDGTDTDGIPNLAPVNTDGFDDGITFFPPYFCKGLVPLDQVDVVVTVSDPTSGRYDGVPAPEFLYLSSFFDFNDDGDWGDVFTCVNPNDAPEHLLIQAVGGPGAFSVVNPLPADVVIIAPSLWGGPPTQTSMLFELYFYSPTAELVAETIWSRFRVEYDDHVWPTPDNKFLGTEFDYSLFGEVEDYVIQNSDGQPGTCYLIQDEGAVASYFSGLGSGDVLAKYFDPELYCEEPVYPLSIEDVKMLFYDFAGVGTIDIRVNVYMVCHDTCDGPGTHIYRSDPITITTFYPDMAHIVLEDVVCVNGPFFIGIEWVTGEAGSTPCMLMEPDAMPCDSCHAWMYYPTGGADWWIEWYEFWSPPPPGCPILRVSAFTSHPDCEQAACETPLEMLWGGLYAYYFWKEPPNDKFINMMFQMPLTNPGRLDAVEIAWYASGTTGTPDPDVYVWLSDGTFPLDNNPPYQAIAEFHVANEDLVFYPTYYYIDTHELGLLFDVGEKFHVGGSHAWEAGDTLAWLSDDGAYSSERGSSWDGSAWASFYLYEFLINAYVCMYEPPESTFTLECSPFLANVTPGDPPAAKFIVDVGAILGYNLNVYLSCAPPAGFTVSFDPPNGIPPFASDVYVSVDAGTPYADYTLTLCGIGADAQIVCCDVKARVQPPFDEADVPFFHGSQLATNFGAVGNDANNDNFKWYGLTGLLFDGSFVIATDSPEHMALDCYNCAHWGWVPSQHIDCYYDAEYNANICYGNFYCDELEPGIPGVPGEWDSVFIVGIMDECVDFSIKIKVYYNPTEDDPIYGMYMSLFEDWDVDDAYNNWGEMDTVHNLMWMYDPTDPDLVFGAMKAPFYDDPMYNMVFVSNPQYVYPNSGFCDTVGGFWGLDSLYWLISRPGFFPPQPPDTDFSILMTAGPIDLSPGEKYIEVWIDFGRNLQDAMSWNQWWHRVLRYAGFYRGDVNASDTLELPALDVSDLVYLIQYLFQDGPAPLPYVDQGDFDGSCCGEDDPLYGSCVNIGDVIYLLNYVFMDGPPPIDYVRFIPQCWPRESLFENPNWR